MVKESPSNQKNTCGCFVGLQSGPGGTLLQGDGKDCAPPSSEGVGGETGVSRNLFPRIGVE